MAGQFTLETVAEIPLGRAPLAKVLTQVQYSRTPALVTPEAEERLAERLARYPVRREGVSAQIALNVGVGGVPGIQAAGMPVRLLATADDSWQVTVTETFVALETSAYESRDDFCTRAGEVFAALCEIAVPPVVDRVGLRYVDRLLGDDLARVHELVTPQLQVLHGAVGEGLTLEHSVSDSLIRIGQEERLQVKSGLIPPNAAFDPVLTPVDSPAWLLDLDIYSIRAGFAFDPQLLEERLRRYGEHVYSFFRFATTDTFIASFANENKNEGAVG